MNVRHPFSTHRLRPLLGVALLGLLVACGFHPRGELQLPPNLGPVNVQSADPYSPLADGLARALERTGATSVINGDAETGRANTTVSQSGVGPKLATLRIAGEVFKEGPLTVDNQARVREYLLSYVVSFEFTTGDGSVLVPLQEVTLQRDFTYDVNRALGTASEQATIRDELQRDMAVSILRRIGIVLRNKTP